MLSHHCFIVIATMMKVCIKNIELFQARKNSLLPCPWHRFLLSSCRDLVFGVINLESLVGPASHTTHVVWKPGSMEWCLSAVGVELRAIKKKKQHVKFASLFARRPAFFIFYKKKTEKKLARAWFNHQTHSLYHNTKIAIIFQSESSDR